MRLVQVSDCHVPGPADQFYRGQDPRAGLVRVLRAVEAWQPDLVLATGDLSEDGSAASYAWLAETFGRLSAPVVSTPGNHDDAGLMARHFSRCAADGPEVLDADWRIVLVGSAKPGEIGGRFTPRQLDGLSEALADSGKPALVALHHQPWPVGSPWIDRYRLENPEDFEAVLSRHPNVRLVLWGHVHQDVAMERAGLTGLGCPSSVSNSLPGCARFTPDAAGPACRWLELEPDGVYRTGILRPED